MINIEHGYRERLQLARCNLEFVFGTIQQVTTAVDARQFVKICQSSTSQHLEQISVNETKIQPYGEYTSWIKAEYSP